MDDKEEDNKKNLVEFLEIPL